jgi:hypothetical protein
MGPSFARMVHMLQMCFYDFAAFCAAPELCDDGVRACFFFSVLRNTLYFRENPNAVISVFFSFIIVILGFSI